MNITEFLEARITEDEAALERTGPFPHSTHSADVVGTYRPDCPDCLGVPSRARVLAECAAKRAILQLHEQYEVFDLNPDGYCRECTDSGWDGFLDGASAVDFPCPTVKAIATVYAGHPDYEPTWTPT